MCGTISLRRVAQGIRSSESIQGAESEAVDRGMILILTLWRQRGKAFKQLSHVRLHGFRDKFGKGMEESTEPSGQKTDSVLPHVSP